MKKFITGVVLFSIPFFSSAEIKFVSEVLVGQSQNEFYSSIQGDGIGTNYSSSLSSDSFALRFSVKFTDNLSFELAKHDHGSVVNQITIRVPQQIPGNCCLGPEYDNIYEAQIPIETNSLRVGLKGELEIITDLSISARLGIAYWGYGDANPQQLSNIGSSGNSGESGNDIYYAVGAEYKFTENFYLGVEYSLLSIHKASGNGDYDVSGYYDHGIKDLSLILGWEF
jgi:hypothetical protein